MGIQFKHDHSRPERSKLVKVVIPQPDQPLHVVIGHNQIFWRTVALHYDKELRRPIPCLTSDCRYCPQPTRETTYVPCLLAQGVSPGGRFSPRIIPVTDGWSDILDGEHEKNIFKVVRVARTQACRFTIATTLATYGLTPYAGQEIENSLYRMWGVKK